MDQDLTYCPHVEEVMARLRRLFVDREPDAVCATMQWPNPALRAFAEAHPRGFCDYPDPTERIEFWDRYFRERSRCFDDSIPCVYLSEMDQGLYGGLVGGKVEFMSDPDTGWISSMVHPLIEDWEELDELKFDETSEWYRRYLHQLRVYAEGAAGRFGISHFILINGLNFVFELLGATRTYQELVDNPEMIRRASDFAFELNLKVQRTFFEEVEAYASGTCSNMVQWFPGQIITESVDPFHMASVDYFERWGREQLERIFAEFDGGVTHIHGNGRHLLEAVSTVRGLKAIYLGDDQGFPAAFEVLPEIRRRTGDLPLVVGVGYEDFRQALHERCLVGGVLYRVGGLPDTDEANRVMGLVRRYSARS
jgi:hypothetical protein